MTDDDNDTSEGGTPSEDNDPYANDVHPSAELEKAIIALAQHQAGELVKILAEADCKAEAICNAMANTAPLGWRFHVKAAEISEDLAKFLDMPGVKGVFGVEANRPEGLELEREAMAFLHVLRGRLILSISHRKGHVDEPSTLHDDVFKRWKTICDYHVERTRVELHNLREASDAEVPNHVFQNTIDRTIISNLIHLCAAAFETMRENVKLTLAADAPASPPESEEEPVDGPAEGETIH